jgi:hypothetical protein
VDAFRESELAELDVTVLSENEILGPEIVADDAS